MGKRDKTRFEKWFSLSCHHRRSGAKVLSSLISSDFHLPLIPLIASGGLGNPWKITTLAPLGINGALSQDFIHDGQQRYLKLGTHSSCQYSSFPNL
jgi:hypothetical protein